MTNRISSGDFERRGRNVRGTNSAFGSSFAKAIARQPGARSDVRNQKPFAVRFLRPPAREFTQRQAVERDFDDMFRFRPGNKHVRRNFKFQTPEFLFAGEVLRGLAVRATINQR